MRLIVFMLLLQIVLLVLIGLTTLVYYFRSINRSPTEVLTNKTSNQNRGVQIVSRTNMRLPSNKLNEIRRRRSGVGVYIRNKYAKERGEYNSTTPTNVIKKVEGSPRFPNNHDVLELDSNKYSCDDPESADCATLTSTFGKIVQKELYRVLSFESNVFRSGLEKLNIYKVRFEGSYGQQRTREELLCAMASVGVRTVSVQEYPRLGLQVPSLGLQVPRLGLQVPRQPLQRERRYATCAVVSSAGALLGSRLGQFIDSHDMVIRFNNAPTENYTEDVGSKTTLRILNSQVVTKPEFNFLEDRLYDNISILIWDPAEYGSTLDDWYRSPDYPVFQVYKRFLELHQDADIHILDPQVLWDLWDLLQSTASKRIKKNPPSSGFIGIWFALQRCENVRVFEYVPSSRVSARCHYYSDRDDRHCTLGTWHPLSQEKILTNLMRNNSDFETYQRGFVNLPAREPFDCRE